MSDPERPLRVVVVSHAAVVDINQEPFAALAADGADVTVIAPRRLHTDIRGLVHLTPLAGSAARLVPLDVVIGGYRPVVGQKGIHLIVYRGLTRALAQNAADVIFVEEEPYSLAAIQVARAAGATPFVVHENQNVSRRLPFPFEVIRGRVLKRARGVTVRNDAAAVLVRGLGFTGSIGRFPHAVDPARFAATPRRVDLAGPIVGFVGRLVPEKGIMDLIAAVAALRAETERGSLLVIGGGPLLDEARARAAQLGIPSIFTGAVPHDDVPTWYGAMDVVCVPSRTTRTWMEQFGRIVIEANAAGVPVIVSDSGELPRTVAATGGGAIVPEGDVTKLTEALVRFGETDDWGRSLGDIGRAAVERMFTPRAIARELHRFLREVARGGAEVRT